MSAPRVSVLMAVRDGERYLDEAMESVLGQTFENFEYIVIDDGSTDRTAAMLEHHRRRDPRIRIYPQASGGLVEALNRGLQLARGSYVARMDADDVCAPGRLAAQVALMDAAPDVGLCGTWIETFGLAPSEVRRYPTGDPAIRSWLLFESVLAHPSVMIRRETFERHCLTYDATMSHAEDYDLWVRAAQHTALANIPQVLLRYRLHANQVVRKYENTKRETARRIRLGQLHRLGLSPSPAEMTLHEALCAWDLAGTQEFITATHAWFLKLLTANHERGIYPQEAFQKTLGQRWSAVCTAATHLGLWTLKAFWRSPLLEDTGLGWAQQLKFGLKCGMRKRQHA